MKIISFLLLFCLLALSQSKLLGQNTRVFGKVLEANTGFELMGATLYIEGSNSQATISDLEGAYELDKLAYGEYRLICEYIGFETQSLAFSLSAEQPRARLDFSLQEAGVNLQEALAEAKIYQNTETALLTRQRQAAIVMDGISASQMSKTGDNDAASAMQRITGVTVEGGKYVYVRGLSDRYSKTTLNGAEIPGLDPNRNTVQMDLFPTSLLDNIMVYKTFSPDLYGDFSGGYVDVQTKDFPEQFTLQASASMGYNSQASYNTMMLRGSRVSMDALAWGAAARALPQEVERARQRLPIYQGSNPNPEQAQALSHLTRQFNNNWALTREAARPRHNLSLSLGNQSQLGGRPLGWVFSLSHQQNDNAYQQGAYGIYELTGNRATAPGLTPQLVLQDELGQQEVLWGAMFSSSYKINNKHRLGFSLLHNQSGTATARALQGKKFRDDPDDVFYTQTQSYLQRSLSTAQLYGKHQLGDWQMDWQTAYAYSTQQEPDIQYFTYRYQEQANIYFIKPSSDRVPSRFYRDMWQGSSSNRLDLNRNFKQWEGKTAKFKTGLAYLYKAREFSEDRLSFRGQNTPFNGNLEDYFSESNLLTWNQGEQAYANQGRGLYLIDDLDPANSYQAWQAVTAAYAMTELPLTTKLRLLTGFRLEQTSLRLNSESEVVRARYGQLDGQSKLLNNLDLLPAFNLIYDINAMTKLRGAYARTLARPSFRELAPFASFDVEGGYLLVGNPELQRSRIDNFDLRWEYYPSFAEIISVSSFFKYFDKPIERTYNPEQPNGEFTFRNVEQAILFGAELELRKNLGFFGTWAKDFSLATNFSYLYSRTEIDPRELAQIRANDPEQGPTREMFGQAPYSFNALLSYKNNYGTQANLSFNVVGPRMVYVTIGATPQIYEMPRNALNFNLQQRVHQGLDFSFALQNLLLAEYREVMFFKNQTYEAQRYPLGLTVSLGLRYKLP